MKNKLGVLIIFCLSLAWTSTLYSQSKDSFLSAQFVEGKDTLKYRILYPASFDPNQKYPLVLFLHGSGERGTENKKQLAHGSSLFLKDSVRTNYPAIVIFPQCTPSDYWAKADIKRAPGKNTFSFNYAGSPNKSLGLVIKLLESYSNNHFVDLDRLYLGGLSMGGMGVYEVLYRKPELFAAALVICGAGNPYTVGNYAEKVPVWVFHGEKDDVVSPKYAEEMVKALRSAGASINFTLYPNANHNSWDPAFQEAQLLPWLFSNSK